MAPPALPPALARSTYSKAAALPGLCSSRGPSLVELLAWVFGVVQQQLAGGELASVDGLVLPQAVHQAPGAVCICVAEGTCRGDTGGWLRRARLEGEACRGLGGWL